MAKIKVILEAHETPADADEALLKALNHHSSGDAHDEEAFEDPAMIDATNILKAQYDALYADMLSEIFDELDKEYI